MKLGWVTLEKKDPRELYLRYFLLVFHLLLTLVMIGVILMQRGEDASAGSGSGGGMPGARSGKNFLTRLTAILAGIFFANCVVMAILVRKESKLNAAANMSPVQKKPVLPNDVLPVKEKDLDEVSRSEVALEQTPAAVVAPDQSETKPTEVRNTQSEKASKAVTGAVKRKKDRKQ